MALSIEPVGSPFTIHEDEDPFAADALSSPDIREAATEEEYEADDSVLTSDEIFPSVETDVENLPVGTIPSSPPAAPPSAKSSMRMVSSVTKSSRHSAVSSLPASLPYDEQDLSPYVPMKNRPTYRDGSARKLQMASPPDTMSPSRSSSYLRERPFGTPKSDRRLASPRTNTVRSNSTMRSSQHDSLHDDDSSYMQTPSKKEHPLVLLHVTIIPQPWPYSAKSMAAVLPDTVIANQHLLEEKLNSTTLARGLLLSHPGEEYDLLEERILESLELCTPRILKCGHFHTEDSAEEEESSSVDDNVTIGRGCNTYDCPVGRDSSDNMVFDPEAHCTTCHQSIALPNSGTGHGSRRWDVKVYAANGLMRSGAWSAAWKEMEKVDVEIGTWVPDQLRRELDRRLEEEEADSLAQAAQADRMAAHPNLSTPRFARAGTEEDEEICELWTSPQKQAPRPSMHLPDSPLRAFDYQGEVPLATLLRNCLYLVLKDQRNMAIFLLSMLVLLIALRPAAPSVMTVPRNVSNIVPSLDSLQAAPSYTQPSSVMISTVTITESILESAAPVPATEPSSIVVSLPSAENQIASITANLEAAGVDAGTQDQENE